MIDESIVPQFYTNRVKYGLAHYADASGASLVCVAEDTKKKMNYVAVVIGASRVFQKDGWRVESYGNFNEMLDLLEYGFNNFKVNRLIYDGQSLNQFSVIGGESEAVGQPHIDVDTVLPIHCQMDNLEMRYSVVGGSLTAPVKKDEKISTVEVWYRNSCVTEVELYAMSDVKNADKTGVTIHSLDSKNKKSDTGLGIFGIICFVILGAACSYIGINVFRRKRAEARRRRRRAGRRRSY
jgi:D-alanyl-D-alanine carboxypeptidase